MDFSDATDAVVARATDLAKALQAQVTLLHVAAPEPDFVGYEPGPQSVRDTVAKHVHEEHKHLQMLEKKAAGMGVQVASLLIQGYTVEKILMECERLKPDLIVMGSHGHSALHQLLVGSVTEGVLRKATCPVVVVPHRP
ncbi:MAG: universal stress protein [Chloroflexota bacterium]